MPAKPGVPPAAQRRQYRSTGRVDWPTFLPIAALTLLFAVVMGAPLHLALVYGFYIIILVPVLMGLPLYWLVGKALEHGRCRSRVVGAAFGVVAGLVMYVAQFYAGLVSELGLAHLHRVDFLPSYINWQMQHMVQQHIPDLGDHGGTPTPALNWGLAVFEAGLVALMCGMVGAGRAGRVYCEQCRAWTQRSLAYFAPGSSRTALDLLNSGRLSGLARLSRAKARANDRRYTAVAAEYCAPPADLPAGAPAYAAVKCPVFLTVKEITSGGGLNDVTAYDTAWGKTVASRVELAPAEVRELSQALPALAPLAPPAPAQAPPDATSQDM